MANNRRDAVKNLGQKCADRFAIRITTMSEANNLEELRYAPGRFHELKGDKKGLWACDLEHPYRLIFTPHENPIPTNENGQYIWIEVKGVEIMEIVDYH